jgi:hypothetical protein
MLSEGLGRRSKTDGLMSEKGQNENPALTGLCQLPPAADISRPSSGLLDNLVGTGEQHWRHFEADCLGSL